MKTEASHRQMYDSKGNIIWSGFAKKIWSEFGQLIKIAGAFVVLLVAYQKVLIYVLNKENRGAENIAYEREEAFRESGMLKGERYICRPARQIDDPDIHNYPSFSSKDEDARKFRPKLFDDDTLSSGPLHNDRK
eukprot:GILJ01044661.1.p1 GENE.GILJ01044661.1~~GILJ01044661.1.p1  ORF type:complete len:134 (+),score=17.65 GILJ01044661.1:3-404(+)